MDLGWTQFQQNEEHDKEQYCRSLTEIENLDNTDCDECSKNDVCNLK